VTAAAETVTPRVVPPRTAPRAIPARVWVDVAVVLVLTAIGTVGLSTAFTDLGYVLAGVGGMLVGTTVALLCARYRLPTLLTAGLAVGAYFLLGSGFAIPEQAALRVFPTAQSLAGLAIGAVFGWADLVTLRAPVSLPYYVDAVPYAACWLVTLVSVTLAARWLSERRRSVWGASLLLLGPLLIYLAGVLLGTDLPYFAAIRGIAFAAIALVWLGWRRARGPRLAVGARSPMLRRRLIGTAIIVASAVVIGGVGGTLLAPPPGQRFVLRDEVQPPVEPLNYPTPLGGFRSYVKNLDDRALFAVSGIRSGQTLRLATLDSYNGVLWSVAGADTATDASGAFRLVGHNIPTPSLLTSAGTSTLRVTVLGYHDVWIPDAGYPTAFSFGGSPPADDQNLRYNAATGTAVLTTGLQRGQSYELREVQQKVPSDAALEKTPTATLSLPPAVNVPDVVRARADEIMGKATSPIDKLRALEQKLKSTGFFSHGTASDQAPSRAGHGADRMAEMITRSSMVGDQEQYASLFALMARSENMPARVVMGFAPKNVKNGSATVTGADVTAWVEVAFQGVGWIPFFPTPDNPDVPQDQVPKPQTEPQPQIRQPPRTPNQKDDLIPPVEINDKHHDEGPPFALPAWVVALGLGILIPAAIVFLPMLIVAWVKRRRRDRRRALEPDAAVAGAWDELLDRLVELGYETPSRVTREVAAQRMAVTLPVTTAPGVAVLARQTDDAVFSGRDVEPELVDSAWNDSDALVAEAWEPLGRSRRVLSRYRLASVRRWSNRLVDAAQASARR